MGLLDNRVVVLSLRAIQALFAIIVLGLTAYGKSNVARTTSLPWKELLSTPALINIPPVVDWWSDWWNRSSPSPINFLLFTSIWTLLVLLYLILVPWRFSGLLERNKWAGMSIAILEGVTMIFWFAGFVALAVWLGRRTCVGGVCSAAKAATVFAAFEWWVSFGSVEVWDVWANLLQGCVHADYCARGAAPPPYWNSWSWERCKCCRGLKERKRETTKDDGKW
jgi:hypothetical protein